MYDFIIIGGGILGLSVAMQLIQKHKNLKIALLEKENELALHQTGHNSGVIHAGVYYAPNSLKARFCVEGNQKIKEFAMANNIKFEECGKLLVATNEVELERMKNLFERSKQNGLNTSYLNEDELRQREPNIVGLGGVFVPSSAIISYIEITQTMAKKFIENGGKIFKNSKVMAIKEQKEIIINTERDEFRSKYLIACAGLMSDKIVNMMGISQNFIICPFRGEYFRLDSKFNNIVNHLIYPIPDPETPFLGVHLTRMIDGSVTVGPNAVLAFKREGYKKSDFDLNEVLNMIKSSAIRKVIKTHIKSGINEMQNSFCKKRYLKQVTKYCPIIMLNDLLPYPAGVRAQAVSMDGKLLEDFLFIRSEKSLHVCNAPSPAATSSLPIGLHIIDEVYKMLNENGDTLNK